MRSLNFFNKIPIPIRCVLSGLCIAGSVPPWGWWPLAFIGIALLDRLIANQPAKTRFKRVYLIAATWLYVAMLWMWDMTAPGYVAAGAILATFFGVAGALTVSDHRRKFILPGTLALAEVCRWTWPFGGIPLANLGLSQVNSPLVYASRIGGSLLVIVLVVVVGQAVSSLFEDNDYKTNIRNASIGAIVATVFIMAGLLHPKADFVREINVALIQGGGPQNTRATNSSASLVFDRHIGATKLMQSDPDLIIWPENAINPNNDGEIVEYKQTVKQDVASRYDATLLSGWFYPISDTQTVNFQSSISPDGVELDRYDKVKLVPFGEYVPFRSILESASGELPSRDVKKGSVEPVLDTPVGPVGVAISWEGYFDVRSRHAIREGAQILTNPTNGASYWLTQVQTQQVAANQMHAVENDRWVLQVAPTGLSAIINPDGEVVQRTGVSERAVLQQNVEMLSGRTLASYLGFWPVALYGLAAAAFLPFSHIRNRRDKKSAL